jgi:hypothetical protein
MKLGKDFLVMNSDGCFRNPAQHGLTRGPVRKTRSYTACASKFFRAGKKFRAQRDALLLLANGISTQHEAGKIQLELVAVVRRVRAFHVANLALIAGIDDAARLGTRQGAHVAIVPVDSIEKLGKRRA